MPRPTVAAAQGREAIYDPPAPLLTSPPATSATREERIERKTYHLDKNLVRRVADAARPGLTQSQIVNAALRLYFGLNKAED